MTPTPALTNPYQAAIFDFDGVVLESDVAMLEAVKEIYGSHGIDDGDLLDRFRDDSGRPARSDYDAAVRAVRSDYNPALRHKLRNDYLDSRGPRPGFQELLSLFRDLGFNVALASNSPADWVMPHLQRLGLDDAFDKVVLADGVVIKSKPAPDVYAAAADQLGVKPSECIAIEDSATGTQSAIAAGCIVVAWPSAVTAADFRDWHMVENLRDAIARGDLPSTCRINERFDYCAS